MSSAVRRTVFYSGRVQGVGFRYTAQQIAQNYAVAGFVRNLPDRRVELVAEGDADQVQQFLDAVAEKMSDHIRDSQILSAPATHEFAGFEIRH